MSKRTTGGHREEAGSKKTQTSEISYRDKKKTTHDGCMIAELVV